MQSEPRLAVAVEKDRVARAELVAGLQLGGVGKVRRRGTPQEVRQLIHSGRQLHLLAVGVHDPSAAALDLIRECRQLFPRSVILAVDHESAPDSVAMALGAGADDVVRAPYSRSELVARLVRRLGEAVPAGETLQRFAELNFSPVESRVLRLLYDQRGKIVTRSELARALDNSEWVYGDRRFDVHITKIRRKLRAHFGGRVVVRTVRSEGYRLDSQEE